MLLTAFFCADPHDASAQKRHKHKASTERNVNDDEQNERKFKLLFLEANRQSSMGNMAEAFSLLRYAEKLNPQSAAALYELGHEYFFLNEDSIAEHYLKQAISNAPHNNWYKETLASYYISRQRTDDAIEVLEEMVEQATDKSPLLMELAELYSSQGEHAKVIKAIDRIEQIEGKSEQLSMRKYSLYTQLNDEKRAFAELRHLADEYPNDPRYRVVMGNLYLEKGDEERALQIYREVEQQDSINVNLRMAWLNYYSKKDDTTRYNEELERLILLPELDHELSYNLMRSIVMDAFTNNNQDSVRNNELFRQLLSRESNQADLAELYARYMITYMAPADSVKPVLRYMLNADPENETARNQLLSYAIDDQDTTAVISLCRTAVDYGSDNPLYYYYLGVTYYQGDHRDLALHALTKGLENKNGTNNMDLVANMYAIVAELHHVHGDDEKAFLYYDSCLVYRPDYPLVLNNYAYYLALRGEHLDKAEQMSRQSLLREGDNYTYVDTYAWILFCQGRYDEAVEHIDKAVKLMLDAGEPEANILEHAGDIHFKAGQPSEALELWKEALLLEPQSDVLMRKVKRKTYIKE